MKRSALLVGSEWLPYRAGGLNRYFHGLVRSLSRSGIPHTGLVTFLRGAVEEPPSVQAMAPEGSPLMRRLAGARASAREAAAGGLALLNGHFALYTWPCLSLLERATPVVVNFHGPWADEMLAERGDPRQRLKAALARAVEKAVYKNAHRIITLSTAFLSVLVQRYGVDPSVARVVPGGADLEPFRKAPPRGDARIALGWPEDRLIVLAVRRLAKRVGLDLLIEAAASLRPRVPELLVLIAGTGHAEAELKSKVAAMEASDTVRFLGFVPEETLPLAYAAADVTAMPSVALEGFGLSLVESLAAGTPAVGTPVGGIPEVLGPLDPSLITDDVTPEGLTRKLEAILRGALALPGPDACREYAARFDWAAVLPRLLAVWREAGAEF